MFMCDVHKKEEIRNIAIKELRALGVKYRVKKSRANVQHLKKGRCMFKVALHLLPTQTVTLTSGQQLVIPKLLHDLCSFILTKVETEGLFRKGGSKARQNEIRLSLDAGCRLDHEYHEIDVANVLKTFFRELPEPLFPYSYHDVFLQCMLLKENKVQALLLTCLLLPCEHLNTLAYFLQFLNKVTEYSSLNKMDSHNLAIIIGPTVFPLEEKPAANTAHRISKICELIQLLVESAYKVGVIMENIIDQIIPASPSMNSLTDEESGNTKKKKKRRSGSLTRMFSGLRKIVSSRTIDLTPPAVTPDLLMTPTLSKSAKKRKLEAVGFSHKKKRELLETLSQGSALRTPVVVDMITKDKKSRWSIGQKAIKLTKRDSYKASQKSSDLKATVERRWSATGQVSDIKQTKRLLRSNAMDLGNDTDVHINNNQPLVEESQTPELEYIKMSRTEYEEIKSRVSEIERRISIELDNIHESDDFKQRSPNDVNLEKVQTAYEKTLVQAEPLSPTTDHLARRLSKELKIRRSCEQKVVRSPSARKIGSLRRRSRERAKVIRNQTWHVGHGIVTRSSLKRGKPNTIYTGLPHPVSCKTEEKSPSPAKSSFRRSVGESFPSCQLSRHNSCNTSSSSEKWKSANGFFSTFSSANSSLEDNCRASIAKLRRENAGVVLAKARLFDELADSDVSANSQDTATVAGATSEVHKIGAPRNRAKNLRYNEKQSVRQTISPRKKSLKSLKNRTVGNLSTPNSFHLEEKENQKHVEIFNNVDFSGSKEKSQLIALKDCNRNSPGYMTPKGMPQIKRSLTVKTPKRVCKTPNLCEYRQTPLKVVTLKQN